VRQQSPPNRPPPGAYLHTRWLQPAQRGHDQTTVRIVRDAITHRVSLAREARRGSGVTCNRLILQHPAEPHAPIKNPARRTSSGLDTIVRLLLTALFEHRASDWEATCSSLSFQTEVTKSKLCVWQGDPAPSATRGPCIQFCGRCAVMVSCYWRTHSNKQYAELLWRLRLTFRE